MGQSTWKPKKKVKQFPELGETVVVDVAIIGGGLTGVASAYLTSNSGASVALVEKERVLESTTLYTTAHVTCVIDTRLTDLVSMFGAKKARLVWNSGLEAIDEIERIAKKEKIPCEFNRVSAHIYAREADQTKEIVEDALLAKKLGFRVRLKKAELLPFDNEGFYEVPRQALFHPIQFAQGLLKKAEKNGARIFEKSEALKVEKRKGGLYVQTKKGTLIAQKVLVATYQPFNNPKEVLLKKGMYKSYVHEAKIKKGAIQDGLYWDYDNPYHYFRVDGKGSHSRVILGGQDHRVELPLDEKKSFASLKKYFSDIMGNTKVTYVRKWSGPILEPIDGLALIGEYDPGRFVATAFSGNGMTYAMISARMFSDYVAGKKNPWSELYDPTRIPTAKQLAVKGRDYVEEFFGGAVKNLFKGK